MTDHWHQSQPKYFKPELRAISHIRQTFFRLSNYIESWGKPILRESFGGKGGGGPFGCQLGPRHNKGFLLEYTHGHTSLTNTFGNFVQKLFGGPDRQPDSQPDTLIFSSLSFQVITPNTTKITKTEESKITGQQICFLYVTRYS